MDKRYNTKLFSSGAEHLVLAKLLLAGIETYITYENQEGYDLLSINAKKNLSAKKKTHNFYSKKLEDPRIKKIYLNLLKNNVYAAFFMHSRYAKKLYLWNSI